MKITYSDARRWQVFWDKVEKGPTCWNWIAGFTDGYGMFGVGRRGHMVRAHRFSYEKCVGPIPDGMIIHHKCENTACVNPAHLTPVTDATHPGNAPDLHRRKTHCKHGHEFTPENTQSYRPNSRNCRICTNESHRKSRANS